MNLQDRAYAIGIFVVLGICCIGAYVAVSGFMNANPQGLTLGLGNQTPVSTVQSATIAAPTETETSATVTAAPLSTSAPPTNTPKGFSPTLTPLSRGTPSPAFLSDIPTVTLAAPGTAPAAGATRSPTAAAAGNCGSPFCPIMGKPDETLGPTGQKCPRDYLWGIVQDRNGKGLAGYKIHFRDPSGNEEDRTTKGPPDPPGKYDQPTGGGGKWFLQLRDPNGKPLSPMFPIESRQSYNGGAICPTRVDFVEQ